MGKRQSAVQQCGAYNDTGKVHKEHTRFGDYTLTYGEYRGHYQSMFFEGPLNAVFWTIGERLNNTSHCYEHTFQVRKVEIIQKGETWNPYQWVKVECEWTSYVGD